jgi:DNA-directed RNA polymerase specialized sigma subunit
MNNYLEEQYKPAYETWQGDQTPEGNAAFLKEIAPIVQKGVQMYGNDSPLAASQGRLMALEAMKKYDPARSRLQSHVLTQMQGLRRAQRKQHEVIRAPERVLLENYRLNQQTQELSDELGRDPTDSELSDSLGISMERLTKLRRFQPGISSGQASSKNPESGMPASRLPNQQDMENYWTEIVYQDLGPVDQKIMEMALGMHGQKKLSNLEIAKKLNRSPGAITQRKVRIQDLLNQESDFSPFIG